MDTFHEMDVHFIRKTISLSGCDIINILYHIGIFTHYYVGDFIIPIPSTCFKLKLIIILRSRLKYMYNKFTKNFRLLMY